jgi:hypothetical protein
MWKKQQQQQAHQGITGLICLLKLEVVCAARTERLAAAAD